MLRREYTLVQVSAFAIGRSGTRVEAQEGCLIYASAETNGGDLSDLCAYRGGLCVGWPMDDTPSLNMPTEGLFPNPSDDHWYDFFLSTPLVWRLCPRTKTLSLGRPIPATVYFLDNSEGMTDVWSRIGTLNPRLVYPWVAEDILLESTQNATDFWHGSRLSE